MASVWNKMDAGLAMIYADFVAVRDRGRAAVPRPHPLAVSDGRLHVMLRYEGSLAAVEGAGFETIATVEPGNASGTLRLEDLEAIGARDETQHIHFGSERMLDLDRSIPQINADDLWTQGGEPLYEFSGITGEGVIVGIIDSGVDIHHPFLWRQSQPRKETRILRIWDQGLVRQGSELPPDVTRLDVNTPGTYGVEYRDLHINDVLNDLHDDADEDTPMPVRHRDCANHGTMVASIAAGDGRYRFKHRGVAPRAGIIVVKAMHLENSPKVGSVRVSPTQRFKDAVAYIKNMAAHEFGDWRPCVINYSVGLASGAHDGFDADDWWLNEEFSEANSVGRIFVATAGNNSGFLDDALTKPRRRHARIVFTSAKTIDVPLELFDTRTVFMEQNDCTPFTTTRILMVDFVYPFGGANVSLELKPKGASTFTAGPALGGASVGLEFSGRRCNLFNLSTEGKDGATVVKRNVARIAFIMDRSNKHLTGDYMVRLTASGAISMHLWCEQPSLQQGLKIKQTTLAPEIIVEDKFVISSPGCVENVITVGAYNAEVTGLDVAHFSARGPVPRHGSSHTNAPPKPDIAAPGVKINAANSSSGMPKATGPTKRARGTSYAAPHVTGVIALLLQVEPTLTPSKVRRLLRRWALKTPTPDADEIGGGRLDAKKTVENIHTP